MEIPRTIFTKEKANYWRFMSLVYDIGGDVLREMLSEYWKKAGSTLELFLGTNYTKYQMQILLTKGIITQNQHDLLYPANSVLPDIKLFDISLLFTLLRNLHPKLKTGDRVWTGPNDSDLSREADIRRVTDFRNRVVHSHTASMSDVDFVANWTSLETILHRLVQNHPIETDIKLRIVALQTASHSLHTEPAIDRMTDCDELIQSAIEQETSKPSQGITIAHWAAFSGRVNLMKMLVDNRDRYGVDIEQLTHDGKNAMHIACEGGYDEMFFYLFKEFPDMLHEADSSGRFPWHWAAYGGNLHLIKSFCKMKRACNINLLSTDYNGRNVIFYAALGGQGTIFTFLRDTFPQLLKETDDCGFTIGHYAVYGGEVKIMETLLQAKEEPAFDLNARSDSGMSLLHTACLRGSLSMFELLASHGDQNLFDTTDDEGKSVAHWAATGGNVSIMKYLQQNHADSLTSLTGSGQTILHEACAAGKEEMFDYILSTHPDMLNVIDDDGNTAAHWVAFGGNVDLMKKMSDMHDNKKVDILTKTDSGESILHKACASGKIAMFDFVRNLPFGFPQEHDDQGYTILHWAAIGGCLKIIETILDSIENKEEIVNITNDGQNILHMAASVGQEQVFDFLYSKYPALLTGRDDNNNTIAHVAVRGGNHKLLQRLINLHDEQRIDLNDINEKGQTIMHVACMCGSKNCFDILLKTVPAMINKIDWDGSNVFHWAAYAGNIQLMKTIQNYSVESDICMVNIEDKTYTGANLLHFACLSGREKMFHYIISNYKCMLTCLDNEGFTMAHWTSVGGNVTILRFLEESGKVNLNQSSNTNISILHAACVNSISSLTLKHKIQPQRNSMMNSVSSVKVTSIKNLGVQGFIGYPEIDEVSSDTVSMVLPERIGKQDISRVSYKSRKKMMFDFIVQRYSHMLYEKDVFERNVCHLAAKAGNKLILEYIKELIEEGNPSFTEETTDGMTVLHYACFGENFATFQFLLQLYPQLKRKVDYDGYSVIHWAANGGNVKIMEYLFDLFRNDDFSDTTKTNRTILVLACESGERAMFNLLLCRFPHLLHINDIYGKSPAHWAAYGGNVKVIDSLKTLHETGTIDILQTDDGGKTLLHYTCIEGKLSGAEFILNSFPNAISTTDNFNRTVMHFAAFSGNTDLMKYLMKLDLERKLHLFKIKGNQGRSILDHACEGGHKAMFDLIIKNHPELINVHDDFRANAAHWAAFGGNVKIMDCLKTLHEKKTIDILRTTSDGRTLLHWACQGGKLCAVEFILKSFPNSLAATDNLNRTAMHFAAFNGNVDLMKYLMKLDLERKLNLFKIKGNQGRSILDHACEGGHKAMFDVIIKKYPELINVHDDFRANAAHWAAFGGNVKIMECLNTFHKNGTIDILSTTKHRQTVIDIACSAGKLQMFRYLSQSFPKLTEDHKRVYVATLWTANGGNAQIMEELILQQKLGESIPHDTDVLSVGQLCLHLACLGANYDMFSTVLKNFPIPDMLYRRYNLQPYLEILLGKYDKTINPLIIAEFANVPGLIAYGGSVRIANALKEIILENDFLDNDATGQDMLYPRVTNWLQTYLCKLQPHLRQYIQNAANTLADFVCQFAFLEKENDARVENISRENYKDNVCQNRVENIAIGGNRQVLCKQSEEKIHSIACNNNAAAKYFRKFTLSGENILHTASRMSRCMMFDYLVQEFPDMLEQINFIGRTTGHFAAMGTSKHIMKRLFEFHLEGKINLNTRDYLGQTILLAAAAGGNTSMFTYIYKQFPGLIKVKDNNGNTAAHWAAYSGSIGIIRFLLEQSTDCGEVIYRRTAVPCPDIFSRTNDGKHLLHCAVLNRKKVCFDFVAKQFPGMLTECDKEGKSVLHYAAQHADLDMIKFLLDGHYATRVSTRKKTNNGKTILHYAAFNNQQEVIDYLIQNVPEMLTELDDEGKTVFHYLAENGYVDRLRNIMEEGHATNVNLKERTRKGMTILHIACEGGHRRMFDYIIEKVPELLNVNDYDGRTVTYWALNGCNKGIIRKVSKYFRDLAPSLD